MFHALCRLKTYFLHDLFAVDGFHKNSRSVITRTGAQDADAELATAVIAFVFYFKRPHTVIAEEVA